MKLKIILLCLTTTLCFAQNNGSGFGTTSPDPSAAVDITSTKQGLLPPRMTTVQRDAITAPANGLIIYNTDTNCQEFYNNAAWYNICWGDTKPPAIIIEVDCTTQTVSGNLTVGKSASAETLTISVKASTAGSYNISTDVVNGVSFSGSGTAVAGTQNITLTATGTPTTQTISTYTLNTTPSCKFSITILPSETIKAPDGSIWMAYNVGATTTATSATDYTQYGSLYQWGRGSDGHQLINWTSATTGTRVNGITNKKSYTNTPLNSLFIIGNDREDWRSPANKNLWQGLDGANNPCPTGFRVPTMTEWKSLFTSFGITNIATAYSKMKLVLAGQRTRTYGSLDETGVRGYYWTSTPYTNGAKYVYYDSVYGIKYPETIDSSNCNGYPVRCIKN